MDLDADWFERAKAWIGGSLAALLGALFPFFRERLKKKNEQLSSETQVEVKHLDVAGIVAQQLHLFTEQMVQRISTLESRENVLTKKIGSLEKENEECRASNRKFQNVLLKQNAKVDQLTQRVSFLTRDNERLRDWNEKQAEEIRKMQKALDFTPLETPVRVVEDASSTRKTIRPPYPTHLIETPFNKDGDDGK